MLLPFFGFRASPLIASSVVISDAPGPPVTIEENDTRVSYTGAWVTDLDSRHSGGRAAFSDEAEATATLTFTGTGIQLFSRREESSGFARVTTDSFTGWGSVDAYASPAQDQALILSITGLTAGTYKLTVSVQSFHNSRSKGNRVWIDGFNILGAPAP